MPLRCDSLLSMSMSMRVFRRSCLAAACDGRVVSDRFSKRAASVTAAAPAVIAWCAAFHQDTIIIWRWMRCASGSPSSTADRPSNICDQRISMNDVTELVNITWTASSCSYLHIQLRPPALPLPSADLTVQLQVQKLSPASLRLSHFAAPRLVSSSSRSADLPRLRSKTSTNLKAYSRLP